MRMSKYENRILNMQKFHEAFSCLSDIGVMTQPGIKQEPLSPGDNMMPSCSRELVDLEEVLY